MQSLRIDRLQAGQVFDRPLLSLRGLTLLPAGEPVTSGLIERLALLPGGRVNLGDPDPEYVSAAQVGTGSVGTESDSRGEGGDGPTPGTSAEVNEIDRPRVSATSRAETSTDAQDLETARRRAARRAWEVDRWRVRVRAGLRRNADELVQALGSRWERLPRRILPGPEAVTIRPVGYEIVTRAGWNGDGEGAAKSRASEQSWDADASAYGLGEPLALELASERAERVAVLRRCWERLLSSQRVRAGTLVELVDELIDLVSRHPDRFGAVALNARRVEESVCEHAYATGALSVAIAVRLGWSVWDVRAAGLAGLMADSGMMLLANDLRSLARPLTEVEWNSMRRHPAYSLALSAHVLEMPEIVPLAVYQHHEREDGSGYPLGLRTHGGSGASATATDRSPICDVARVVAVADVLAGASAPRAHRPRLTAHGAVQLAVREAAAGRLDKATVRAAVKAVGVFPAGSYVRLSSGQLGLVESVHDPERADRPIVRLVETNGFLEREGLSGKMGPLDDTDAAVNDAREGVMEFKPDVVDLCAPESSGLSVIEALEIPDGATLLA